jgi:hypothetical protein
MNKSRIYPNWDQIKSLKQEPTEGELYLLKYLDNNLPQEWEIFFQPCLNGDRPDIAILNRNVGLMIIEVKDWNPNNYTSEEVWFYNKKKKKKEKGYSYFVTDNRGNYKIPSPIAQVERYRENLIGLYLPQIGEQIDVNTKTLSAFRVGLYLHNMSTKTAKGLIKTSPKRCTIFGNDLLKGGSKNIGEVVPDFDRQFSLSMKEDWHEKIRFWLIPPYHSLEQGMKITLNPEQRNHATPKEHSHQRLRGVAGSGKTLVIAQRAASLAAMGKRVLIVTYNITLRHYIRDHVARARYGFDWEMIEFNHFHGFCKNYLNENDIKWPDDIGYTSDEFLSLVVPQTVIDEKKKGKNRKSREYDAILIDEGQDFEKLWYDMLCLFLNNNDELLLVLDEKQNIYSRDNSWTDSMNGTKFRGRWRILKESYRIPYLLLEKVNLFAEQYLPNIGSTPIPNSYQTDFYDPHYIWRNLNGTSIVDKVDSAFNWLTRKKGIHPQDIIILLPTHQVGWSLVKYFNEKKIQVNHVFEDDTNDHQHKRSFWMGDSRLKMSTFHSFKGWELMNVILIIPPDGSGSEPELDSLIYTSLTRTRSNLIVFNRHSKYVEYGNTWPETW